MKIKQFSNGNEIIDLGITKDSVNVYICLDKHLKSCNGIYPGNAEFFNSESVHFDVQGYNIILYENVDDLKSKITARLQTILTKDDN